MISRWGLQCAKKSSISCSWVTGSSELNGESCPESALGDELLAEAMLGDVSGLTRLAAVSSSACRRMPAVLSADADVLAYPVDIRAGSTLS